MTVCCKNATMGYDCQCNSGADMTPHDDMSPEVFSRIEALKTELSAAKKDVTDMESRALKAEAENARLREALRGILMAHWERGTWKCVALRQKQYARAALEENER